LKPLDFLGSTGYDVWSPLRRRTGPQKREDYFGAKIGSMAEKPPREGGVVPVPIHDPEHWRKRAEDMRTLADQMNDKDSKQMMLGIAEDYEKLAKRAEERLKSSAKIKLTRYPIGDQIDNPEKM
jgi:hypothetical protein